MLNKLSLNWLPVLRGTFAINLSYTLHLCIIVNLIKIMFVQVMRRLENAKAQLARAPHGYCKDHGFESCTSLNFFYAFFPQLQKLHNCVHLNRSPDMLT